MTRDPTRVISVDAWRALAKKTRAKYHAEPCLIDGQRFDSHAEARRFLVLQLEQKAGIIHDLTCQPVFPLVVLGTRIGVYRADFSYYRGDGFVVEDVKGVDTPLSRLKRRHVAAQYGLEVTLIRETRHA